MQFQRGALGEPIKKDLVFLFVNYEGRRDDEGASVNAGTVPTAPFRAGTCNASTLRRQLACKLTPADIKGMDPQRIGDSATMFALLNAHTPCPTTRRRAMV